MKDHYVAQTYLEAFTNTDGTLVPYYKGKNVVLGKPKPPKAVCFEIDGDANKYFDDPRILDKYLAQFENPWKENVTALRAGCFDDTIKFQVSGYLAFLRTCTLTAKRLNQERTQAAIQPPAQRVLERQFRDHPPPDEEGQITIEVDRQFPHAVCISHLHSLVARFARGTWLVMINESTRPFITSDNPAVAYYLRPDITMAHIYAPVAPDIALLIAINRDAKAITQDVTDSLVSRADRFVEPKTDFIDKLNELIIRAAEVRVLHHSVDRDLEERVRQNSNWRMAAVIDNLPTESGTIVITRELPREWDRTHGSGSEAP